jgi:hypothetical protein
MNIMKTNKQKHNWLIDAALFVAFLLSFWLELTGVALHQWLGVAIGAVGGYHLLTHWTWVKSVTNRFFKQTSLQARLYYIVDATVLIGLATIIVTGLVISTWFDLALTNYATWKTLHVIASLGTLAAVVIKLGLHWRWIVATARRYIFPQPPRPAPVPVANGLGRREFLRLMGGVSVVATIAAGSAVDALRQTAAAAAATTSPTPSQVTNLSAATSTPPAQRGTTTLSTATAIPSALSEATPSATATTSVQAQSVSSCTVRCNKNRHCMYPGQCRRYTDSNNNGRCDLGECV